MKSKNKFYKVTIETELYSAMRRAIESLELQNIMHSEESVDPKAIREMRINEMVKLFEISYPRLKDNPEQHILLKQMCALYVRLEFELIPMMDAALDKGDIKEWKLLNHAVIKMYQQWDRLMTKMGFTYASKPQVTARERKNYNPKASEEIRDNVVQLIQSIQQRKSGGDSDA